MAWVQTQALWLPDTFNTSGNLLIDANGEKAAWVLQAPKTGTIDRLGFATNTVTTGDTVDVRMETVDTTTGDPTGTLFGTTTNKTQVINAADDNAWFEVTLTSGASVTRGDFFAVVVALPAAGATGNMNIRRTGGVARGYPYCDLFTGTWAKNNTQPVGSVRYSDGTYPFIPGLHPALTITTQTYNSTSTPDERGIKFTPPYPVKVSGIWYDPNNTLAVDVAVKLYDASNNVLGSKTFGNAIPGSNAPRYFLLDAEATLIPGQSYRATIVPQSATNVSIVRYTHRTAEATQMSGYEWGIQETTRADAGAWTDTADARTDMGLIISAIDAGSRGPSLATLGRTAKLSGVI